MAEVAREGGLGIGNWVRRGVYKTRLGGKGRVPGSKGKEHSIKKDLRLEIPFNQNLLKKLRIIEDSWLQLELKYKEVEEIYQGLKQADSDPEFVKLAARIFGQGENSGSGGLFSNGPTFDLQGIDVSTQGKMEKIFALGNNAYELADKWRNENTATIGPLKKISDLNDPLTQLEGSISNVLKTIQDIESKYRTTMVGVNRKLPSIEQMRASILLLYNNYSELIRFSHTYKVIKPFVYDEKTKTLLSFANVKHPNFPKYDWEQNIGLDENGFPLEIDNEGYVLLDRWMGQIWENEWQRSTIENNKNPGWKRFLERCEKVSTTVRQVRKEFAGESAYIDLLEMTAYVLNEIDAVRDDLRDGRYHPHSKTATDYIIHAERNLKGLMGGAPVEIRRDPREYTYVDTILRSPIKFSYDQLKIGDERGFVKARPERFIAGTNEDAIQRLFRVKSFMGSSFSGEGERRPTDINPAFDRRAIHAMRPFLHWGRMLYYEDSFGINLFSQNPYPCISTRGIAKYILFFIVTKTETLREAAEAADNNIGYDMGVRDLGGPFMFNPFASMANTTTLRRMQ